MRRDKISAAVIRRLPRYCRALGDLHRNCVTRISSSALGQRMGLTASQIRQDLSCFGEFGQQGYGYNVDKLYAVIRNILCLDQLREAILIGVGNLGRALMQNFDFAASGFHLQAAFDVAPELIGRTVNGVKVLDVRELERYLDDNPVTVAVLTLPAQFAQKYANLLMENGIRGIWNFTNFDFEVPAEHQDVVVESLHFSDSMRVLSYLIGD